MADIKKDDLLRMQKDIATQIAREDPIIGKIEAAQRGLLNKSEFIPPATKKKLGKAIAVALPPRNTKPL